MSASADVIELPCVVCKSMQSVAADSQSLICRKCGAT